MSNQPSRQSPPGGRRSAVSGSSAAASAASAAAGGAKRGFSRPAVMAVSFAAVIVVGSLTGAQLKQDKQKEETIKKFRAVEPAEQIRTLEEQRKVLMDQRGVLQRKIDLFQDKVAQRKEEQEAKR